MSLDHLLIILFFPVTIAFGIGIFLLLRRRARNREFDERQRLARGKAYQAAFWTFVIYSLFSAFMNDVAEIQWADSTTGTFMGLYLAIAVFAIICIITDSFFSFRDRPGPYFTLFLIVIAANLMIFLLNLADGTPMATNGLFNTHSLNLFAVIALIPIYVTLLAKYLYDKKHAETE
jgi:membrane associated rhomboid family serine protease